MALRYLCEVNLSQSWALHNALKSWTLFDLSESEVKLLLLTFSENELKLTKICQKGDSKWDGVLSSANSHFLSLDNRAKYSDGAGYPNSDMGGNDSVDTEFLKTTKVQHPRVHNRYEVSVPCQVNGVSNRVFDAHTQDLSEGGISFNETLPDWVAGYFLVIVDNRFNLLCSVVEDQKERTRIQISSQESDPQYLAYKEWLLTL
jgi:hypothetical protein